MTPEHTHHHDEDFTQKLRVGFLVLAPLLATIAAVVLLWNRYVFASDMVLLLAMYVFTTPGITIGYHRMLTHQGFKAPEWLRGLILIAGSMAWEGSVIDWTATHVKHHAHSDEHGDPHSPLEGFWHAHMGWLFSKKNFATAEEFAPWLLQDKTVMWVNKYSGVWMALALIIPFAIGGWTGLLWGGFVRIFLTTHITWSVNSVCHTFGRRDFHTTDESRNHWLIGLLGFGEGWHNNHHAFPTSAFHGLKWWQFDASGIIIGLWEKMGLVWDVQRVSEDVQESQRIRMKTAREMATEMRQQLAENLTNADTELRGFFAGIIGRAVDDVERAQLLALHSSTMQRLSDIRAQVGQATNMKRQRVSVLTQEFQKTVQSAKEQAQSSIQRMAMQAQ